MFQLFDLQALADFNRCSMDVALSQESSQQLMHFNCKKIDCFDFITSHTRVSWLWWHTWRTQTLENRGWNSAARKSKMALWQCCGVIFREPRHNALNLLQEHRSNNLSTPRFLPALGALRQQKVNRKWGSQASAPPHHIIMSVYNLRHKPPSCPRRP